jgi:hypothetical protein
MASITIETNQFLHQKGIMNTFQESKQSLKDLDNFTYIETIAIPLNLQSIFHSIEGNHSRVIPV